MGKAGVYWRTKFGHKLTIVEGGDANVRFILPFPLLYMLKKKKNLRIVTENYVQTLNKQYTEWYVWYDCNYENMFTHI